MFEDLNLERYENRLVDFKSSLFCPRRFSHGSKLRSYLAIWFPNIFNSPIPYFGEHQFFTLYMIMLMLHIILECFDTKEYEVILLNHDLAEIFNLYLCTKAELRDMVKDEHLEPIEHFDMDLFDPWRKQYIPHPYTAAQVWTIKNMVKYPNNRRALTTFVCSNEIYDLHPALKARIERNERLFDPNFQFVPTTAKEIMELTLNLLLAKADIFLNSRNINVIVPPFTWYFDPENSSSKAPIHISNFPNRLLKLMFIADKDPI